MCSKQSLSLIKGVLLYSLLISFMEKQPNSEAIPLGAKDEGRTTIQDELKKKQFTFKVEHLQDTSSCTYVVEPVSKRRPGNAEWQLEELYDIMCVNLGQNCSTINRSKHKCMQTYKTIKVGKNSNESMKIYTGCVCAYNRHGSNKTSIVNVNS